ncbi:MAG: hypothetical protein ACOYNI_12655 [Acidimicrobiia bacterium]
MIRASIDMGNGATHTVDVLHQPHETLDVRERLTNNPMLVETGIFVETGGGSVRFWIGPDGMQASTDGNQPFPLDPKAELVMRPGRPFATTQRDGRTLFFTPKLIIDPSNVKIDEPARPLVGSAASMYRAAFERHALDAPHAVRPDVANPPLRHRDRGRGRDNRFER